MKLDKTHLIVFIAGAILGICAGFFSGKAIYDRPLQESVTRDTVRITDTIPHYYPQPVDGTKVRTVYKFLTRVQPVVETDTLTLHDSVLVEVPIESRHYHAQEYDAWVSGYEPSLDSIKVYRETQYITERVTISKPPNRWELDIVGGINYNVKSQRYTPFAGGEILYKPNRLQLGIHGGVEYTDKAEPVIGGVVKIRLY